jgi:RimJ/RimL family protein N-acetyltransferase
MQIRPISRQDLRSLDRFLLSCGDSLNTFRYFSKRSFSALNDHLITLLGFDDDGTPIAYGHLDQEEGTVWLGICVAESHKGKGHGKQMINALIESGKSLKVRSIHLTVDDYNNDARKLYESTGFRQHKKEHHTVWYSLNLFPE